MYDIAIIGCGISGMTAAIYAARANKKVVVFDEMGFGGQIVNSSEVENFPGFINITGFELSKKIYDQIINLNVEIKFEKVNSITTDSVTTNKETYKTKTIIIANGLTKRKLGLYSEQDYIGKGISYCATCDGNFYKNKIAAIVGGGNTALEDALYLSEIVDKLYVIHRKSEFTADKILVDRLKEKSNIIYKNNCNVTELKGNEKLEEIVLDNGEIIKTNGLFIAIGNIPNNLIFSNVVDLDERGYIISSDTSTKHPNIFVAGDTRTSELKQLITASSDGALAASKAIKYLQ